MAESAPKVDGFSEFCTGNKHLEKVWEKLLKIQEFYEMDTVSHFFHCTSKSCKNEILHSRMLRGEITESPELAPLAANTNLKGVWFVLALEERELPKISPYGTQRIRIPASVMMNYMVNTSLDDDDDNNDPSRTKSDNEDNLFLFFESSYTYNGKTQYVRLLLVRSTDPNLHWCKQNLHEVNLYDNPFFQWSDDKLLSSKNHGTNLWVEILVVRDIVLDKLTENPVWDVVKKGRREGGEPDIL
ncbi:phytanoyl-CoA hydroxylase-interacting protein-like [Saccostrea echinata]|uniref:phytanoyl-CoA hydroxylase-interacting protein-like n=1 Tax=Saccostrea echinata TaxID=191078 RepID=UPI002A822EE9|nr:phytanoyl-CoA hydroxylase-interacting protein-like [Saccostrea echinata]